jgi:hypothetical protein
MYLSFESWKKKQFYEKKTIFVRKTSIPPSCPHTHTLSISLKKIMYTHTHIKKLDQGFQERSCLSSQPSKIRKMRGYVQLDIP